MGVNFSCSAAGEATNNQYQNNNNGFREFYREYTHIHRHGARLQQLDVAAHRLWRMLSPEDRQSYARREVRRMTSRASVASSRSSNVSFGSIYSEPSSSDSVIHRSESENNQQTSQIVCSESVTTNYSASDSTVSLIPLSESAYREMQHQQTQQIVLAEHQPTDVRQEQEQEPTE
ncbi:hypothetical protein CBL_21509 [Carabus blaptoides fortunei]